MECSVLVVVVETATKPSRFSSFLTGCRIPCTCHGKRHLNVQKSTFDLEIRFAPKQSALFPDLNFQKRSDVGVLSNFDLEMCFASQRRALFRYLNFQKWSDVGVLSEL